MGSLAGKGRQVGERSGTVRIKAEEPGFIMGIISFTPIVDYSQGNKHWTLWEDMDDLHKPALDGIGFQPLITDEIYAADTVVTNNPDDAAVFKSAGKQPSWIEYMTAVNECFGGFAMDDEQQFMTFSRRYEMLGPNQGPGSLSIRDLTTYIDPRKFNYAFANNDITAQNLWVQIGIDFKCRRKMSAKMIPNL